MNLGALPRDERTLEQLLKLEDEVARDAMDAHQHTRNAVHCLQNAMVTARTKDYPGREREVWFALVTAAFYHYEALDLWHEVVPKRLTVMGMTNEVFRARFEQLPAREQHLRVQKMTQTLKKGLRNTKTSV